MSKHLIPELAAIVDTVATHLAHQRRRATTATGTGRMRSDDGCMCAIGCLIPEPLYHPRLETGVFNLFLWAKGIDLRHRQPDNLQQLAQALVDHFQSLAPSLEPGDLRVFLEELMIYHDSARPYVQRGAYQVLLDSAPDLDEGALKEAIAAQLLQRLHTTVDPRASWWEAQP